MSGKPSKQSGLDGSLAALLERMRQQQRASQSALIPFGDQKSKSLAGLATGHRLKSEKQTAASAAANTQRDDFGRSRNHSGMSLTPSGIGTGKNTCQTLSSNSSSAEGQFTSSKRLASHDARDSGSRVKKETSHWGKDQTSGEGKGARTRDSQSPLRLLFCNTTVVSAVHWLRSGIGP